MSPYAQSSSPFSPKTKAVRKSLKYSLLDGSAYSAMLGLSQDYIVPFALALKATTAQIGWLTSIPNLAMALSQLAAPHLADKAVNRKSFILPMVLIHALMWAPIILLSHLVPGNKVWFLIIFFALSTVFNSLGNPAWGSMMADLVPARLRGRYFGLRGQICGFITLIFTFMAGLILHFSATSIFLGFSIIFGGAMLFRLVSLFYLSRMYEPPLLKVKKVHESMKSLLWNLGSVNLGRFITYVSLLSFSTYLAGPFFAVFMLRDLRFDYLTFVTITVSNVLANLIFLTFWGKRCDRLGNIRVLRVTSILIPLIPVLWLGSRHVLYLIPLQIFAGFAWAGFTLASNNFLYDASAPENRTRWLALFNAMNGFAMSLGSLVGGYLASNLPSVLGHSLLMLFLLSGLARALVVVTLLRRISEVRPVSGAPGVEFLFGRLNFAETGVKNLISFRKS